MITPKTIRTEIQEHTKSCKKYDDMMDNIVHYIINNFNPKKNRPAEDKEVIPEFKEETNEEEIKEVEIIEESGGDQDDFIYSEDEDDDEDWLPPKTLE